MVCESAACAAALSSGVVVGSVTLSRCSNKVDVRELKSDTCTDTDDALSGAGRAVHVCGSVPAAGV